MGNFKVLQQNDSVYRKKGNWPGRWRFADLRTCRAIHMPSVSMPYDLKTPRWSPETWFRRTAWESDFQLQSRTSKAYIPIWKLMADLLGRFHTCDFKSEYKDDRFLGTEKESATESVQCANPSHGLSTRSLNLSYPVNVNVTCGEYTIPPTSAHDCER
jgi:hypothetical protein